MVLLDRVVAFDGETARCEAVIGPDHPFADGGRVRTVVTLEHMAQCVGVCTSLRAIERGEPLAEGYLVGAREMTLAAADLLAGDRLEVEATLVYDGQELGTFECRVRRGGEEVARGVLNVFRRRREVEAT
jgi:predicted hotdog family 3-hydroxylacyl-ACP dehydratase